MVEDMEAEMSDETKAPERIEIGSGALSDLLCTKIEDGHYEYTLSDIAEQQLAEKDEEIAGAKGQANRRYDLYREAQQRYTDTLKDNDTLRKEIARLREALEAITKTECSRYCNVQFLDMEKYGCNCHVSLAEQALNPGDGKEQEECKHQTES
jgi:hypothetical protein